MKLFRHGPLGSEAAGAVDARGVEARYLPPSRPISRPDWLAPEKLNALSAIDLEKMPQVPEGTRIGAPVGGSRQFIAIGLNYRKHAAESGMTIPNDPLVFNKALTCIQGPNDDIVQPEALGKARLGSRTSLLHRDQGPACEQGKRAQICRRLLPR